jgi:hypothetical protein
MKKKSYIKNIKKSNFQIFYYLFYDYNKGKIVSIIYDLINFFQLLSMNLNLKVNYIFNYNRRCIIGEMIQKSFLN